MPNQVPVRRYIEVRQHPTVVRLDHLDEQADWITSSFYATPEVKTQLDSLGQSLKQSTGTGVFLIGQYGSGKSHWLAYLTCAVREGRLGNTTDRVVPVSLLNFRATVPLEDIVTEAVGISPAQDGNDDRRHAWRKLFDGSGTRLILILDELSEFLRSKPTRQAFNEDVRFLQFLGEWAQGAPFWIIAAMQEGIEHTGEIEYGLYRKIKDRFPLRFLLSPAHVKDLIQESILVRKSGWEDAVDSLAEELQQALPESGINFGDFRRLYPLHPVTLELLEEIRDRFSQARGIVDFTVTQLSGDPSRQFEPFLDQPWGSLLTPDYIIDHFQDLFEVQPEFIGLAQQYFAYYRNHLEELFPIAPARALAERIVKLLALTWLSSSRDGLTAEEASAWLLFRATRIEPRKNLEIVQRTLQQLAARGRFVVQREGRYHVELREDGTAALESLVQRYQEELQDQEEMVFEQLVSELEENDLFPLSSGTDWQPRKVRWHFHDWPYQLYVGNATPPEPAAGAALCLRLPWGSSPPVANAFTLQPRKLSVSDDHRELAALLKARERVWNQDVLRRLTGRIEERLSLFKNQFRRAYEHVQIVGPDGDSETPPRLDVTSSQPWLDQCAQWMMRRRFPSFEQFAPVHGPLPREAFRSLMRYSEQAEVDEYDADDYVKLIREAYLVPMKLLKRRGRTYAVPESLDRHELVALIRPLLDLRAEPSMIYENAAVSAYGLVPDQVGILLVFLLIMGEIDIVKGRRSYREYYETLPDPRQYDKVLPCEALRPDQLQKLQVLCNHFQVRVPTQWTVLAQRRTTGQLKAAIRQRLRPLRELLAKLHDEQGVEELEQKLRQLLAWEDALQGHEALEAFQQFLYEIGSPQRFIDATEEVRDLPEQMDRLLEERKRFVHLLQHPALAEVADSGLATRFATLRTAPPLGHLDAVREWLKQCREVYDQYKATYSRWHEEWCRMISDDEIWSWQPPRLAGSRHIELRDLTREFQDRRQEAQRRKCQGLGNLDFQPQCPCGFDGETSPVEDIVNQLHRMKARVERTLGHFFQQEDVRQRMQQWIEQGLETNPATLAYLKGELPYPHVEAIEQLDQHLAGIELTRQLDVKSLVELLVDRPWDKEELKQALLQWHARLPDAQLQFASDASRDTGKQADLANWAVRLALRYAEPVPDILRRGDHANTEYIEPDWVSHEALAKFDSLGLGEALRVRVVRWLCEGRIPITTELVEKVSQGSSPVIRAAIQIARPTQPSGYAELAQLTADLYRAHEELSPIGESAWLDRLEALAHCEVAGDLPSLTERLMQDAEAQHVLIDGLGLAMVPAFLSEAEDLFPSWKLESVDWSAVPGATTTDACYQELVEAGYDQRLEKINKLDQLIHDRYLPFAEFQRFALAELAVACRAVRPRLDEHRPVLVFADHGFRLAADGKSYGHGGTSTLERVVPLMRFQPR